jgi:ABC-type transporter Mla subunit MlaD
MTTIDTKLTTLARLTARLSRRPVDEIETQLRQTLTELALTEPQCEQYLNHHIAQLREDLAQLREQLAG